MSSLTVDLLIKNGKIATPHGVYQAGIAIDEGRIVTVGKETNLPKADKVMDKVGPFVKTII